MEAEQTTEDLFVEEIYSEFAKLTDEDILLAIKDNNDK